VRGIPTDLWAEEKETIRWQLPSKDGRAGEREVRWLNPNPNRLKAPIQKRDCP